LGRQEASNYSWGRQRLPIGLPKKLTLTCETRYCDVSKYNLLPIKEQVPSFVGMQVVTTICPLLLIALGSKFSTPAAKLGTLGFKACAPQATNNAMQPSSKVCLI
jgi:hypothetical protein